MPEDGRIGKDTCTLRFPINPIWSISFEIGEEIKYTDKSFLILEGVEESMKVWFKEMKRGGSVNVANFAYQ